MLIQAQDKVPVGHVETWLLKHATFYYEFYQETQSVLQQTDTSFLRIQWQSPGLKRTVLERQLSKKKGGEKKKDEREKKLFHLIRDRGEERGIRRITKRPTD